MFSFWGKSQRRQLRGSIFRRRSQIDDLGRLPGPPRAQPLTLSADQRECERVWGQNNRTPPQGSISKDTPQQLMPAPPGPGFCVFIPPQGGPIFRNIHKSVQKLDPLPALKVRNRGDWTTAARDRMVRWKDMLGDLLK